MPVIPNCDRSVLDISGEEKIVIQFEQNQASNSKYSDENNNVCITKVSKSPIFTVVDDLPIGYRRKRNNVKPNRMVKEVAFNFQLDSGLTYDLDAEDAKFVANFALENSLSLEDFEDVMTVLEREKPRTFPMLKKAYRGRSRELPIDVLMEIFIYWQSKCPVPKNKRRKIFHVRNDKTPHKGTRGEKHREAQKKLDLLQRSILVKKKLEQLLDVCDAELEFRRKTLLKIQQSLILFQTRRKGKCKLSRAELSCLSCHLFFSFLVLANATLKDKKDRKTFKRALKKFTNYCPSPSRLGFFHLRQQQNSFGEE